MYDDEVAVNGGTSGTAIGEGEAGEFFHQGVLPDFIAVTVKAEKEARTCIEINISGFFINDGCSDSVAVVNGVAQEVAVAFFPNDFSGYRMHADDGFLKFGADSVVAEVVEAVSSDHWNSTSLNFVSEEIILSSRFPFFRKVLCGEHSVPGGATIVVESVLVFGGSLDNDCGGWGLGL